MAAVLACGDGATLSHRATGEHLGLLDGSADPIDVTIPGATRRQQRGIRTHRRDLLAHERDEHRGIPVTAPACTLVDLATVLPPSALEAAVNAADKLDLIDPESLRATLDRAPRRAGVGTLRRLLDRATFALTDSELERRFLPLARGAGLGPPLTQQWIQGFRVDFVWPDLGLVVETDGLRYHRTAAAQARDRLRDQRLAAAGLSCASLTPRSLRTGARRAHPRATAARLGAVRKVA